MNPKEHALELFSAWYEFCLENGLEPEEIVSDFGDLLLITKVEEVDRVARFLNNFD